jgi:FlaA1/EpsC-like NDP-sugar epimerase
MSKYINFIPRNLRSQWAALLHDGLMTPLAWFAAFWLRFNLDGFPPDNLDAAIYSLAIILPMQLASFHFFGLYKGVWRFASLPDILRILKAAVIGVTASMLLLFVLTRAEGIPRSVPVIYGILLVMFLSGPRFLYRWFKDHHIYLPKGKRVLIVGAGQAGEMLARDILRNQREAYQPIAFVDDNPRRRGREIHGLKISGTTSDIPSIADEMSIDIILIAIPSAASQQMRRIVEICESTGLPFRAVPHLQDLMSGNVRINELRKVSIEDLLGRDPVSLDWKAICGVLSKKTILVTGGGGSIGAELCRQIGRLKPEQLLILDNSEFNLYQIEMELAANFPQLKLQCHLGDVTDLPFITDVFKQHKPDVVFHAAAYKHVPMLEKQLRQAMYNNIIGTRLTAEAAHNNGTGIFVLVSTDKAVNPANIMGSTKRAAEIFCQNLNAHSDTHFLTVRFGNVLGSAGSVIPLFQKQIEAGGPVTVTDRRMERYFMTIPEACQLIMQTTVLGNGGEIFVLDMGDPVKIKYLAEQMIRLSGKIPYEDIDIEYVGLRPGEKLFEELFHEKEQLEGTPHSKVFLAQHRQMDWQELNRIMDEIDVNCQSMNHDRLGQLLKTLVPEHSGQIITSPDSKPTSNVIAINSSTP